MNKLNFQFTNWLKDLPDKVVDVIIDNTSNHLKGGFVGDVLGQHMNNRNIGGLFTFSEAPHYYIIDWFKVEKGNLDTFYEAYPELKEPTIDTTWVSGPYKGQIKDFPEEVVNRMLYEQQLQGNKKDITVFEKNVTADIWENGMTWSDTVNGHDFWSNVIQQKDFDLFFKHYPKKAEVKPVEETEEPRSYSEYCSEGDLFQVVEPNDYFKQYEYVLYKNKCSERANWYYHLNKSNHWAISDKKIKLIAHKGTPEYNSKLHELGYDPETLEPLKSEPVMEHKNNPDIIDGVDTSVEGWYIPKLHKNNYDLRQKRVEQVIEILKQRGFDKTNFHYQEMYHTGEYTTKVFSYDKKIDTYASYRYIDCGDGFLWQCEYDIIHKGTEEYLAVIPKDALTENSTIQINYQTIDNVHLTWDTNTEPGSLFKNKKSNDSSNFEQITPLNQLNPMLDLF